MFSSSFCSSLFALVASALAVSAIQGLSLKLTIPESLVGTALPAIATVVATITNHSNDTLRILNDPASPLSKLPTNTFYITGGTGAPRFTGIKYKYVPQNAAAAEAFTILAPSESVQVEHNLSEAYSFTASGGGTYFIKARNLFYTVGDKDEITPIYADTEVLPVTLSAPLAIASQPILSRRTTYNGCSSSQQSALNSAAAVAQIYALNASSYANSHTSATLKYTTWFGTYTAARHSTVVSQYSAISSNNFTSFNYDCTCTDYGVYAYVYPDSFGTIYLCGAFWNAPLTGTDSRGGTIIHESSHFTKNGGTNDNAYGQSACRSLAQDNADSAVDNADSHEYFAENNPALA